MNWNKFFLTILIFTISCTKNPDFSLEYSNQQFKLIQKKIETNEELKDEDFNLIFKTIISEERMKQIDSTLVAKSIVFSKQKNLVRAYLESFLAFKDKNKHIDGLKIIYNDNPMLIKRYLEYFKKQDQIILIKSLNIKNSTY